MKVLALLAAALVAFAAEDIRVTHPELGFSLVVPDGFVEDAELLAEPDVAFSWYESRGEDEGTIVIVVQRLRYVLGRETVTAEDLPDPGMELMTFRWRGFELAGVKEISEELDNQVVMFLVQVPLRREAIQLIVSAPIEETERAHALLTSLLESVEGETNWLSSTERAERLGETTGRLIAIPMVIGGIVWARRRRRAKLARTPA